MTFVLVLNPMRGQCEELREVARAETREELVALLDAERLSEPTFDEEPGLSYRAGHRWQRFFRPGPLHWYNDVRPCAAEDEYEAEIYQVLSREEMMERAGAEFDRFIARIPTIVELRRTP